MNNNIICNRSRPTNDRPARRIHQRLQTKQVACCSRANHAMPQWIKVGLLSVYKDVYYFRAYQRQWNRRQIIRWNVRKLSVNESSWERKFLELSLPGAKVLRSESSIIPRRYSPPAYQCIDYAARRPPATSRPTTVGRMLTNEPTNKRTNFATNSVT